MRTFKLWNKFNEFISLSSDGILVESISGLGLSFNLILNNSRVSHVADKFENIVFDLYFGIKSNAYEKYAALQAFIMENGRNSLKLEYSLGTTTVYADIYLKTLTKSQKTKDNVLYEKITFERTSYWYELATGTIPVGPLHAGIENWSPKDIEVDITLVGSIPDGYTLYLQQTGSSAREVEIVIPNAISGTLKILSEEKKVLFTQVMTEVNGYNLISRYKDTFMIVPQGIWELEANLAITNPPTFKYKKWVI